MSNEPGNVPLRGAWRNSIEREGLRPFLNRTADIHNNVDYETFDNYMRRELSVSAICRLMGKDEQHPLAHGTGEKYVGIYHKERKRKGKHGQPATDSA